MKKYEFILIAILILIVGSCTNNHGDMTEKRFRGMWKLEKFESFDSVSKKWKDDITRIGNRGFILYDGLGHMAVHLMPKIYNDFDSDKNPDSLNVDELKQQLKIYKSNYVYFADYKVENNNVTHYKLSATNPKDRGSQAVRNFEFAGDTLILYPKEKINGQILRLKWVKL